MDRFRIRIGGDQSRGLAMQAIRLAPIGHIVEVREETRTDAQNRLMWPLLEDVSKQVTWANRSLVPSDWKNGFMMALERAEFVPGLIPGTVWPLGLSTSVLGVAKFSELIELIYSFGAENGVTFRTDRFAPSTNETLRGEDGEGGAGPGKRGFTDGSASLVVGGGSP